eukprot:10017769-Ditylum_brightwellii.AAC.1
MHLVIPTLFEKWDRDVGDTLSTFVTASHSLHGMLVWRLPRWISVHIEQRSSMCSVMLWEEPAIVPHVGSDVEDSSSHNTCGGMLVDSEFEVKEKTSKQGKKCKTGSRKKTENRKKKVTNGKLHLSGAVGAHARKGSNLLTDVKQSIEANQNPGSIESFFITVENDNMEDPLCSDIEVNEDECGEDGDDECKICCQNVFCFQKNITDTNAEGKEEVDGLMWENIEINEPVEKSSFVGSTLKIKYYSSFDTELSSLLVFLLFSIWKKFSIKPNQKAHQEMKALNSNIIGGHVWRDDGYQS